MQNFVQMVSDLHKQNNKALIQELIQEKKPCALFVQQTDHVPDLLSEGGVYVKLTKSRGIHLRFIFVFDEEKTLDAIEDVPVIGLHDVPGVADQVECCITVQDYWLSAFSAYFHRYGLPLIHMDLTDTTCQKALQTYDWIMEHLPDFYDAYTSLNDDESRAAFRGMIRGRASYRLQDYHFATEPQYFLHGFCPGPGDIAIDGGAYDGSTSLDFASLGANVYAFEMDGDNYQNCLSATEGSGIVMENMGLGDSKKAVRYVAAGVGSYATPEGNQRATVIDIDTYATEKNLPRIDYIKLDVEGAELGTLKGASKAIAKWKPKMALSSYHKLEDMWTLLQYVRALRPDYEFAFRHYRIDVHHYLLDDRLRSLLQEYQLELLIESDAEAVLYCR